MSSHIPVPISNPDTLAAEALNCFEHFDDPDLKCLFYMQIGGYCRDAKLDPPKAIEFCQAAISLAHSTGNTKRHSDALYQLAVINSDLDDHCTAQVQAYKAQRLVRISGGNRYHSLMNLQAEIHKSKSEYIEAHNIDVQILRKIPTDQDLYSRACALLNSADLGAHMSAPKDEVMRNLDAARKIFETAKRREEVMCDAVQGDLCLREGEIHEAKMIFQQCINLLTKKDTELVFYSLERLAPLASKTFNVQLDTLQFLGDIFLSDNDENSASSLFMVALEGFTLMDVHQRRAECMTRLGDISKGHGDLPKAVDHWETARPLFERSSQTKQVVHSVNWSLYRNQLLYTGCPHLNELEFSAVGADADTAATRFAPGEQIVRGIFNLGAYWAIGAKQELGRTWGALYMCRIYTGTGGEGGDER
ncbi:hypothetical protein B0H13DRAFT_1881114 [Mycena leptocephala]|nr:hypothetical protein B0H13DRAFT_1881114 [Mycena leptocephala]